MTQLLWINIIMDTLAGLAFAGEAALQRYMLEKPLPRDERLISADMWSAILLNGGMAVSYTHLDVYKRQHYYSKHRQSSCRNRSRFGARWIDHCPPHLPDAHWPPDRRRQ